MKTGVLPEYQDKLIIRFRDKKSGKYYFQTRRLSKKAVEVIEGYGLTEKGVKESYRKDVVQLVKYIRTVRSCGLREALDIANELRGRS